MLFHFARSRKSTIIGLLALRMFVHGRAAPAHRDSSIGKLAHPGLCLHFLLHYFSCSVGLGSQSTESGTPAATGGGGGTLFAHGGFTSNCDLVLASQSPRRLEIIGMMGLAVNRQSTIRVHYFYMHTTYLVLHPMSDNNVYISISILECISATGAWRHHCCTQRFISFCKTGGMTA